MAAGTTRRERILGDVDLAQSRGLEIGPRTAPLVAKGDGPVLYVDYASTEALRAAQFDPSIDPAAIVEVDIVWGDRPLAEAVGQPLDYVVASHVVEHVPDLVGWLAELRAALRPGGVLGLAVPDRRFTFDRLRRETALAEVLEAYLLRRRQPSIGQVFDACSGAAPVDAAAAWRGEPAVDPGAPLAQAPNALKLAASLLTQPRYLDAHVWVFTPASFLALVEALTTLGLFAFLVESFQPTAVNADEFYVRLRAVDGADRPAIEASIAQARQALERAPAPPGEDRLAALERENAALRAERAALTASTSWKLTAPLRALAGRLRR